MTHISRWDRTTRSFICTKSHHTKSNQDLYLSARNGTTGNTLLIFPFLCLWFFKLNLFGSLKIELFKFDKHSSAVLHVDFSSDGFYFQSNCQAGELLFGSLKDGRQETSASKLAVRYSNPHTTSDISYYLFARSYILTYTRTYIKKFFYYNNIPFSPCKLCIGLQQQHVGYRWRWLSRGEDVGNSDL